MRRRGIRDEAKQTVGAQIASWSSVDANANHFSIITCCFLISYSTVLHFQIIHNSPESRDSCGRRVPSLSSSNCVNGTFSAPHFLMRIAPHGQYVLTFIRQTHHQQTRLSPQIIAPGCVPVPDGTARLTNTISIFILAHVLPES